MMLRYLLVCLLLWVTPVAAKPNIVLIMADDFSMNLMPDCDGDGRMSALCKMQRQGMTLTNYYVAESLCCPSRASTMTGMLPHNTGVRANGGDQGGLNAWLANGNDTKTFAVKLQAGGYVTALFGKYLNGWKPERSAIPPGWNSWASSNRGGHGYGYTLNHNGVVSTPPEHFSDKISEIGRAWMAAQTGPYFIEFTPYAPHAPFTPATRDEGLYLDAVVPQGAAFGARPDDAAPQWLKDIPALTPSDIAEFQADYVLRLQASESVDDIIRLVRKQIADTGLAGNTYVIFTSDNGYHMGERSMRGGKGTPFDHDIRVPFVIVGPGIVPGSVSSEMAMNIDLAPTILDLADLPIPSTMDGRSLVPVFSGGQSGRTMAVIEHLQLPLDPNDPDENGTLSGNPPTYTAIRGAGYLYVEYATGEVGYYTDSDQLANTVSVLTPAERATLHDALVTAQGCSGATCP